MIKADPEAEQMLAKPQFLADPVFARDIYLAQAAHSLLGTFLRATKQSPEVFKQVQPAHADSNSYCLKVMILNSGMKLMVVAWTYDLDARGPKGSLGREIWIERSKPREMVVVNLSSNTFQEQVLLRRVLSIQVKADETVIQPPGAEICQLKSLGWYVAGLIPPMQKPPEEKPGWWKFG